MNQKKIVATTLLFLVLLLSPTFLSSSAATSTFGQTVIGSNSAWQSAGVMVGSKFTASGANPVSISVYISQSGSSSNTAKCAIYSESNKQLVAATEEKTVNAGFNGWLTFNFGDSPTLTSGSSYSLVVWFKNSGSTVRYNSGSNAQTWYAYKSYTSNFPNGPYSSLGGYGQENNKYSIYCTLNSVATPQLPSPSVTPSPSNPSSSPTPTTLLLFGQTAVGSYSAWQPNNIMVGSRFTASNTGTLNSIVAYITNAASSSTNAKAAIYSETNKALIASTQEISINSKASGWFTFPTTTSPSINEGQLYSIVVWFENANCYLYYSPVASSLSWYSQVLYGSFPSTYTANGQENTGYSIYATITSGTSSSTQYPTSTLAPLQTINPTPTPTPTSTPRPTAFTFSANLAPILGKWGDYNLFGDVCFGNPKYYQQTTHADFAVTHNGHPSIRIDGPIPDNMAREVNHEAIAVRPGDHVVFSVWIKTAYSSVGTGGIIGFDCYGNNQYGSERIMEAHTRNPQSGIWYVNSNGVPAATGTSVYVPYGRDWTLLTLDVIIPSTWFSHEDNGDLLAHGPQQITSINPWLTASHANGESASIWFADAELYVNP